MPPKPKKIVEEAIEEDQTVVLPTITRNVLKRVITAPKSEKQMEAFRKAQEIRLKNKEERDRLKQEQQSQQQATEKEQKKQEDEAKIQAGTHTRYQVLPKREAKQKPVPPPIQESESEEEEEEERKAPKQRAPEDTYTSRRGGAHTPVLKEKTTRYYRVKENPRFSTSEAPRRRQVDTETETETETETDYDSDYKKPKRVVRREVKKNLKALKQIDEVLENGPANVNPYLQFLSNRWK
jgi:hypothetical protein